MRIALYARKSTESDDRQVQSLEDQIRALKEISERENLAILEVIQESKSAKAPGTRPEFSRLLELIETGCIDGILTWSINRLSRNPVDGGRLAYMLQIGKLQMIRTVDRIYLPDDNALLLSIENGMSTAYIQDLRRNVTRGMQGKVERGWLPGKAPVGYLNNPLTREIDPDPERYPLVAALWRKLIDEGCSVPKLLGEARAMGLTVGYRHRPAEPISLNGLHKLLRNPFYAGEFRYKGQALPGRHQPMLSREEFAVAQDILRGRGRPYKRLGKRFPLAGVVHCGRCRRSLIGEIRRKHYRTTGRYCEYIYYHCSNPKCSKKGVRQEELARRLGELVEAVKIDPALGPWLTRSIEEAVRARESSTAARSDSYGLRKGQLLKRKRALTFMRADNEISDSEFAESRRQLDEELSSIENVEKEQTLKGSTFIHSGRSLVETAVAANYLPNNGLYLGSLAMIAERIGEHTYLDGILNLSVHPALRLIAQIEPPFYGYQSVSKPDLRGLDASWWTQVDEVLNLLHGAKAQGLSTLTQAPVAG